MIRIATLMFVFILVNTPLMANEKPCQKSWLSRAWETGAQMTNAATSAASSVAGSTLAAADAVRQRIASSQESLAALAELYHHFFSATTEVTAQVVLMMQETGQFGFEFAKVTPGHLAASLYRIFTFDPSTEGVKNSIVIPLMGHLRNIRQFSTGESTKAQLAVSLNELLIFVPEASIHAYRFGINISQTTISGLLLGTFFRSVGLPQVSHNADKPVARFLSAALSDVYQALTTPGLTLQERITLILSYESQMSTALVQLASDMGWHEINAEIRQWQDSRHDFEQNTMDTKVD